MIAIGNGEKCPFCERIMKNFKINNKPMLEHLKVEHSAKTLQMLVKDSLLISRK